MVLTSTSITALAVSARRSMRCCGPRASSRSIARVVRKRRRHVSLYLDPLWSGAPGAIEISSSEALKMSLSTAKRAQEHTIAMRRGILACAKMRTCLEWLHSPFHRRAEREHSAFSKTPS